MVDKQYLNSASYERFEQRVIAEQEQGMLQHKKFMGYMSKNRCSSAQPDTSQTFPLTVRSGDITEALNHQKATSASVTTLFGSALIFYTLQEIPSRSYCQTISMTCRIGLFSNCLLWYTAARNHRLVYLQMIAAYKKTHTYKVEPEIKLGRNSLTVNVRDISVYPPKTISSYQLQYTIKPDGSLSRINTIN